MPNLKFIKKMRMTSLKCLGTRAVFLYDNDRNIQLKQHDHDSVEARGKNFRLGVLFFGVKSN